MTISVSIVGGSGYVGGELLRLLLGHPHVAVQQITSQQHAGRFVHGVHPNLRGATRLKFSPIEALEPCDLLFLALPHGRAAEQIESFVNLAERIIDLSADFRLNDPAAYEAWYGSSHTAPGWLSKFVYGLPELHRAELKEARYVSGVGCNATAVNLALLPLAREGLIQQAVIEVKVGSSEGGNSFSAASHHPERSRALRSFAPTGHRHQAEMIQELGEFDLHFSATAVELVRGVLCTAHVFLSQNLDEKEVWQLYRTTYRNEPFVRIVKERKGIYRYPEPKILAGSNFCDVGFAKDQRSGRLVVLSAIDNLMKGAAGTAVQAMNLMLGYPETTALTFTGLHPI
ncbi:N-acetyl-gamma-glutamyl-phosphate reductase [Candidatus Leptofilum sp.]|uniref:N-acetyl-gamma-glutamyl-phosphate reductase n=1 Tax=Candidatus Leptofilum sp. TaxID=3241576 RepID=UPI003B58CF3B